MKVLNSWYNGLVFLFESLGDLVPKRHRLELVEVGHHAFYAARGTFVEDVKTVKIMIFQKL